VIALPSRFHRFFMDSAFAGSTLGGTAGVGWAVLSQGQAESLFSPHPWSWFFPSRIKVPQGVPGGLQGDAIVCNLASLYSRFFPIFRVRGLPLPFLRGRPGLEMDADW